MITGVMSGILQGIGRPGHEAMLGNVVNDKEKLPGAVAIDAAAHHWPSEIGLVLATLFYAALGTDGVFWITSIGQTITGFTLLFLKWEPAGEPEARRHSVRSNFMEGIRYVKNEPVILGLVLLSVVSSIFAGSYGFLLVFFARDVLDKGAHGLGMLMILNSLGVSIGSVAVIAMSNFPRRGVMLMLAALGYTFFILAFSLSEDFLLSLGLVFFMGLFATCSRTMMTMIMQLLAPNEMRGRVMSVRVSLMGLTWIGTLWMGTLAEYITVPTTVLIGGGLYGALALILFATRPQLRNFK
ncbi:MAG: major facilitator superfamily 1 [Dehalococcoidia bacterium]|nr:major facilitator superfamily 1 [Dehalococcoidia bacterium]